MNNSTTNRPATSPIRRRHRYPKSAATGLVIVALILAAFLASIYREWHFKPPFPADANLARQFAAYALAGRIKAAHAWSLNFQVRTPVRRGDPLAVHLIWDNSYPLFNELNVTMKFHPISLNIGGQQIEPTRAEGTNTVGPNWFMMGHDVVQTVKLDPAILNSLANGPNKINCVAEVTTFVEGNDSVTRRVNLTATFDLLPATATTRD